MMSSVLIHAVVVHSMIMTQCYTQRRNEVRILQVSGDVRNASMLQLDADVILWFRTGGKKIMHVSNSLVLSVTSQAVSCVDGCYYMRKLPAIPLRFVVLDTFLWTASKNNDYLAKKQLEWLEIEMRKAHADGDKIIVCGHTAPSLSGRLVYTGKYSSDVISVLLRNRNVVTAGLFSNFGYDSFRILLDEKENPVLAIFTSPLSTTVNSSSGRLYKYNVSSNAIEIFIEYFIQIKDNLVSLKQKFDSQSEYGLPSLDVKTLYEYVQSLWKTRNVESTVRKTNNNNNKSGDFSNYCVHKKRVQPENCINCGSDCYMLYQTPFEIQMCLDQCSVLGRTNLFIPTSKDRNGINNSNSALFVLGVIFAFVIILVGIVLAVNKVYCIHRSRQRNLFLAPLTLSIQAELPDNASNQNLKFQPNDCSDIEKNDLKKQNGFRRTSSEVEQSYNYLRM